MNSIFVKDPTLLHMRQKKNTSRPKLKVFVWDVMDKDEKDLDLNDRIV